MHHIIELQSQHTTWNWVVLRQPFFFSDEMWCSFESPCDTLRVKVIARIVMWSRPHWLAQLCLESFVNVRYIHHLQCGNYLFGWSCRLRWRKNYGFCASFEALTIYPVNWRQDAGYGNDQPRAFRIIFGSAIGPNLRICRVAPPGERVLRGIWKKMVSPNEGKHFCTEDICVYRSTTSWRQMFIEHYSTKPLLPTVPWGLAHTLDPYSLGCDDSTGVFCGSEDLRLVS